jgi:adenine-specific DNA-methyltransferase
MIDLSRAYCANTALSHRQNLGQFFTPPEVARFMCRWVLSGNTSTIYDPAFGLGAFYFAAHFIDRNVSFSGSEIDAQVLDFFRSHAPEYSANLSIGREDYLASWGMQYDAIVCNPPYMRFQKFIDRDKVFDCFQHRMGIKLSGYTNIASAFLVKSLNELRSNGRLAYIMPFEFLNTGYGQIVKQLLLKDNLLKAIIKLEPEKAIFSEATTTIAIILAVKNGISDPVTFCTLSDLSDLDEILESETSIRLERKELVPQEKWLKYFEAFPREVVTKHLVPLNYYGAFTRGIATGANEFFVLSPSQVKSYGIPDDCIRHCITKSAQIRGGTFTDHNLNNLVENDADVYVLNVNGNMSPSVMSYIKKGEEHGYHERYLTKCRNPWYKLERRLPSPLLVGVFSRDGFKVIRNYSSAISLTCYHCFYPNLFCEAYIDHLFLYLRSHAARTILGMSSRRYGENLDKFEPNDLNSASVPSPEFFEQIPADIISDAMQIVSQNGNLPNELEEQFNQLLKDSVSIGLAAATEK